MERSRSVLDWFLQHRPLILALAAVILVAAGRLLASAAVDSASPGLLAGIVVAMLGLWLADQGVRAVTVDHPALIGLLGAAVGVAGASIMWLAERRRSTSIAAVGVEIALVALVLLGRSLVESGNRSPVGWTRLGIALIGLGGVGMAIGAFRIAAVPLFFGALALRTGIGPLCERSVWATQVSAVVGAAGAIAGLVAVVAAAHFGNLALGIFGAALLAFGLTPLTAAWLALVEQRSRFVAPIVGGGFLLGLGIALFPRESATWFPYVVVGLLVAAGISLSWRGEGLLVAALVGSVFVWVQVDRVEPRGSETDEYPNGWILALGDSYISGEGSTVFFTDTNVKSSEKENQCRRSPLAYPALIAADREMGLDFFACSGAVAKQIDLEGQMPDSSPDEVFGEDAQLENELVDRDSVEVVLVSIGGNDAEFGDIGIACVLPGSCSELRDAWLVNVSRIGDGITRAFKAIRAQYEDVPIIAVPYPDLISTVGCGWSAFTRNEHAFLSEFVTVLDDRVRKSAAEAGINYFEEGLFAFKEHRICDGSVDDTFMNFFNFHPVEGDLLDRMNPANWLHGTFHPNTQGHDAIADRLLEHWSEYVGREPANPVPDPDATFEIPRVQLLGTELVDPDDLPEEEEDLCPFSEVSPFASVLPLIDASESFKIDADPGDPICHTRPDGTWTIDRSVLELPDTDGTAAADGAGLVKVHPELPDEGSTQMFVYRTAEGWHVRVVRFCERDPRCPHDVHAWMKEELGLAAKRMVLPVLLVFMGTWFLALGVRGSAFTKQRVERRAVRQASTAEDG